LGAAENALEARATLVFAKPSAARAHPLRELREELSRVVDEQPAALPARFESYLQSVLLRSGQLVEMARPELELCFERITGQLLRRGGLDAKSFNAVRDTLDRVAANARSVSELLSAYRIAVADIWEAAQHPVAARQGRDLRVAMRYVQEHCAEPLRLADAARAAGFAPKYFSRLFRQRQGMTFARHLARVRLERAKELLSGTELSVTRVAELTGYRFPQYFCRVFVRETGQTPLAYRQRLRPRVAKSVNGKLPKSKALHVRGS
jgi:AraC-like DNA-binding protein